ncbi:glycosyltransferase family 2 protein [Spirosoma aureum]|uniref:Glycosyltransferase family 2 protein n=1 Tax=Spirosoma aureum TaxID=2692134 RepID=A0A6G9AJY5_9BACT|nr:glycosyltransferase [Spirosoma aureum]QIP12629.1 glycosyltransferase family 2 protein [Spirosoma aureum]
MQNGVSIVICTYNGASRLEPTLRHIAQQNVPSDVNWEVLLIDNASTDGSARIAEELWSLHECTIPFRVLHQSIKGLSYARDMGFSEAQYEYILMCDDDNWLDNDYVSTAYKIMESHPIIGVLGGHGNLIYEIPPPAWTINYPIHAGGTQVYRSRMVRSYGIYGAGCIIRKSAYETLRLAGFEFSLTDRKGTKLSTGGDMELCYAIALAGYSIYYDNRLQFKHFIPKVRTTWNYYVELLNENALAYIVLEPYKIHLTINTNNLIVFRLMLLVNFSLRGFYLLFTIAKKTILVLSASDTNAIDLKIIWLKARLKIYKNHNEMVDTFRKVSVFRRYFVV